MATVEMESDLSRRDLFTLGFARRASRGRQPPKRSGPSSPQSPLPDWRESLTRREVIISGTIIAGSTAVAAILKPWEWFRSQPEQASPETLESLVAKAKQMEGEFSGNDLSDSRTRNNFTAILADIYSKDAPSHYSKEQMAGSVIWARNLDEFIKLVTDNSLRQRGERSRDYFVGIPAITTDNKKVIVNLTNPAFNTSILRRGGFPRDWNALKSLRRVLLHEFVHLTTTVKRDDEFFALTDIPEDVENLILEGFAIQFKEKGQNREIFHLINELVVDTIANERSNRLFGSTPPIQFIEEGVDLSTAQMRLRPILDAAGIKIADLERSNRSSDFYGFLVSLLSAVEFPTNTSLPSKINYVLSVLDAVLYNNQTVIQEYINRIRSRRR